MSSQAFITSDAELMWNVLPAVALPSQSKFLTARDRNGKPMLVGIGSDSVLRVGQENPHDGLRQLVDLGTKLGIPSDAVVDGFDLFQSSDDIIYLSVAYHTQTEANLLAARPFNPRDIDLTDEQASLQSYRSLRLDNTIAKDVLLGNFSRPGEFPPIILSYTDDTSLRHANVKHFEVVNDQVTNMGDLSLPVNASAIVGMKVGKIKRHTGLFILYEQNDARKLMFSSWTTQFDSPILCPLGASCLATIHNSNGDTDLVVGGDGIWHFSSQDMLSRDAVGDWLWKGEEFKGIKNLHVALTGKQASIWATTEDGGVSYVELDISALDGKKHPAKATGVPLLLSGQGGSIAGFVGKTGINAVFVSDQLSQMSYFEQAIDTKIWKRTPFWFPSLEKTLQIHCYMTRLVVHDISGAVLPKCWIGLKSTGMVSVAVNGLPVTLGNTPTALQTDEEGSINIINPTNDMSSYSFEVVDVWDAEHKVQLYLEQPSKIDPMSKLERILSGLTVEQLSTATTADGDSVFENKNKSDLENAVTALKQLERAKVEIKKPGETASYQPATTLTETAILANPNISPDSIAVGTHNGALGKIKVVLWDMWHYVVSAWHKVKSWAIETYNNIKTFVITIGQEAYRFVLETATQIAKAASFIYTKYLKAPFERFVEWVSNFFSWKDILEVKDNIQDFMNAALDYGSSNLEWATDKVAAKFDGWNDAIKSRVVSSNVPDGVLNRVAGPKEQDNVDPTYKDRMRQSDVKQNWTKYQLTHGGALRGATIEKAAGDTVSQEYQATWNSVVKPMLDSLSATVGQVMRDISLLFKVNSKISAAEILKKLGADVLMGILNTVKSLVVGVLQRLASVVDDFKQLIHKKIKIPIFGDLWVLANKVLNRDVEAPTFTVIDFVSFVLAIPLTLTCKLFTGGRKPPAPPKLNIKTLNAIFDESAPETDKASYNGFAAMLETGASSTLALIGIASTAGLGGALASLFDFQLLFGLIRVAACLPTKKDLPLWEVRCAVSAIDAINVFVLAISRKVDKDGQGEKILATIEGATALVNIVLNIAIDTAELTEDWAGKDEERTGYQILIAILGGVSTIGKTVATVSPDPDSKLGGLVTKQVAGKAAGFFNVVNTYSNISKGKYTAILNSGS
ncbi:hypothetical protein CGLO_15503 [Colletotrichum gloeosporioides Cg-14]|uniref:Uncharacterized protein n=1 Tax=Colletotrichum gloeosporioides (strain Cg-14) TaxID=1237896 RepID=T0JYV0_COLGC|nr:hypothetical protein CGLO_15503 [Colletotrichum gloeosporioides Cg-14]